MENDKDKLNIVKQLNQIKENNQKTREFLYSIQLLMVDNNNGQVKDHNFTRQLDELLKKIDELSTQIDSISQSLE